MADFPANIFTPRTTVNKNGVEYVPEDTTQVFAEDYSLPADEIVAIQETLGTNPQGAFATVKAWLIAISASLFWSAVTGGIGYTAGKVGIGTTSPTHLLTVRGAGTNDYQHIKIEPTSATGGGLNFATPSGGISWTIINAGSGASQGAGSLLFYRDSSDGSSASMTINSSGNVGIGTTSPSGKLDVNDDHVRIRTSKTPASASATGNEGDIAWDSDYIYVCIATDTWKRTAISTW